MATLQFSGTLRNNLLSALEVTVGTSPHLRMYTGGLPASAGAAATGTLLIDITLPSDWQAAPSGGSSSKSGTWTVSASATGTVGYFRLWDSGITTCHIQGDVTVTGGGGAMTVDNTSAVSGQGVTVNSFTINAPNA